MRRLGEALIVSQEFLRATPLEIELPAAPAVGALLMWATLSAAATKQARSGRADPRTGEKGSEVVH